MTISKSQSIAATDQTYDLTFRMPTEDDGKGIWKLVKETGVLDLNSSYSYLMWAKFFDKTSVVVEVDQEIVGFISGFIQPNAPNTLFIWQVAVAHSQRKKGLATRMLKAILHRLESRNIQCIEATVSPSNEASAALFQKLAKDLQTTCTVKTFFTEDLFPGKGHEAERLFQIGPFQQI